MRPTSPVRCSRRETADVKVTPQLAKQIYRYLVKNDYTDDNDGITASLPRCQEEATRSPPLPPELAPYATQIVQLIDSVFSDAAPAGHRR